MLYALRPTYMKSTQVIEIKGMIIHNINRLDMQTEHVNITLGHPNNINFGFLDLLLELEAKQRKRVMRRSFLRTQRY
jgi:hypothetical protein